MASNQEVTITWLGHAATLIETPSGKRILIDPFLKDNPSTPERFKDIAELDLMVITHGHADHMSDAVPIAKRTGCDVIAIVEICQYLGKKGIQNCTGMNKGGTVQWEDVHITMVDAIHSSFIEEGDEMIYAGTAAGYILRFHDGFTLYHSGDTDLFESMRVIGRIYEPDVALLPIGDHFTMGPQTAAEAIRMLGVKRMIPIHWGTFPLLTGTPDMLKEEARDVAQLKIFDLQPGDSVSRTALR